MNNNQINKINNKNKIINIIINDLKINDNNIKLKIIKILNDNFNYYFIDNNNIDINNLMETLNSLNNQIISVKICALILNVTFNLKFLDYINNNNEPTIS